MSFLQLMDVQNVCKIRVSAQIRFMGNSNDLFKMADPLYNLKESFLFLIYLCVSIEKNSSW